MDTASIINEMPGKGISRIYSIQCINKANLCSGNYDVDQPNKEILSSLDGQIKISLDPIDNENVAQFKYLETTVTNQNLIQEEIKRRLNSGNACYKSFQKF
jgi:hypothetical protein